MATFANKSMARLYLHYLLIHVSDGESGGFGQYAKGKGNLKYLSIQYLYYFVPASKSKLLFTSAESLM